MAMETVTNYSCDRCARSEIKDGVTILTLTIRKRNTTRGGGQGEALVSQHVCAENCLKMIKAAMAPVGISGRYDRSAAAQRRKAAQAASTTPETAETAPEITPDVAVAVPVIKIKAGTKGGTKNAQAPVRRTLKAVPEHTPEETRADVVRAVRAITRTENGGWAKGYNHASERKMIAEREQLTGKDL